MVVGLFICLMKMGTPFVLDHDIILGFRKKFLDTAEIWNFCLCFREEDISLTASFKGLLQKQYLEYNLLWIKDMFLLYSNLFKLKTSQRTRDFLALLSVTCCGYKRPRWCPLDQINYRVLFLNLTLLLSKHFFSSVWNRRWKGGQCSSICGLVSEHSNEFSTCKKSLAMSRTVSTARFAPDTLILSSSKHYL